MKALIIDDSQFIRRLLQGVLLGSCKYDKVVQRDNGEEGLFEIKKHHKEYDLIILDWNMPGKDGIQVLLETRNAGITTPIMMCTSEGNRESIINAISAGADEYLVKPFNNTTLEQKIQSLRLKTAHRQQEMAFGHIMVVDDSAFVRKLVANELQKAGICTTICNAADGAMALTLYKKRKYDLILLDWEMPGMSGIEVLRKIRQRDTTTPIIMITGNTEIDQMVEAFDAGVTNFVPKPFRENDLVDKVKQVMMGKG